MAKHGITSGARSWNVILPSLLLAGALLAGCTTPSAPAEPIAPSGGASGGAATAAVAERNFQFDPAELRVKVGTKVTWTNQDEAMHTVTSDAAGGPLDSGEMMKGDAFSYTFTQPGTYTYHCAPHAGKDKATGAYRGMVASIVVEA